MGGGSNGYDLEFSMRGRYGNNESGTCQVSNTGRLTNFNISGGSQAQRISPNQALSTCEGEVQRRLMVGQNDVRVQHGADPGNGNYVINWQARQNGRFRSGQCLVSPSGAISDFRK